MLAPCLWCLFVGLLDTCLTYCAILFSNRQFLIHKIINFSPSCKFVPFFGHQKPWILIQILFNLKCWISDPESMHPDPKHCLKLR
jgi:hypothetical protein